MSFSLGIVGVSNKGLVPKECELFCLSVFECFCATFLPLIIFAGVAIVVVVVAVLTVVTVVVFVVVYVHFDQSGVR